MLKNLKKILNLKKNRAIQTQIHLIKIGEKKLKHQRVILKNFYQFYEELFSKKIVLMKLLLII